MWLLLSSQQILGQLENSNLQPYWQSLILSYVHVSISVFLHLTDFYPFVTGSNRFIQVLLVRYTRSKQTIFSTVNKPAFLNLSKGIEACVLSPKFGLQQDIEQTKMYHCAYFRLLIGVRNAAFFIQINRKILFTKR